MNAQDAGLASSPVPRRPTRLPRRVARFAAVWVGMLVALAPQGVGALDLDPPQVARRAADLRAVPKLIEASRLPPADGAAQLRAAGFRVDAERLRVEIVGPVTSGPLPTRRITDLGGTVTGFYAGRTAAWVPIDALESLALSVPATHFVEPAGLGLVAHAWEGQGPTVMHSGAYRDDGYDGAGIKIAVIDVGYAGLTQSEDSADAPSVYATYDYVGNGLKNPADGAHGRFVVETVYDHAPAASYVLMKVTGQTDVGLAVQDAIAEDVDIIVMSLGWWPSWADDGDTAAIAANAAGQAGILFMNSVGNEALEHYRGAFTDPDNDGLHNWNANDEALSVTVPANTTVTIRLSFNPAGGNHDYDLLLMSNNGQQVLASAATPGEVSETIILTNPNNFNIPGNLVVQRIAGPGTTIEIYSTNLTWNEYAVAAGSIMSPSNATHANVVSVGAVPQDLYGAAKYTGGINADYSSRGPTNGGAQAPDICAPTGTSTSFSPSFIGTSCACPNAAGVVACLWSVNPAATAAQVRDLIYQWAAAGKDWGAPGTDPVYGRGGVHFPAYADCNLNQYPDAFDIASGGSTDNNQNGRPDECDGPGYGFGWQAPDSLPDDGLKLLALVIPSPSPTPPLAPVTGFTWVAQYDPMLYGQFVVRPAPGLIDFLGGAPASFDVIDTGSAIVVECTFALDPSGAPIALPILTQLEVGEFEYRIVATGSVPTSHTTLPLVDLPVHSNGLHTTTGLIVPAIQRSKVMPTVDTVHYRYHIQALGAGLEDSEVLVAYDPAAPHTAFQAVWRVAESHAGPAIPGGFSLALAHDSVLLSATAVELVGELAATPPELLMVDTAASGVSVQAAWSAGLPTGQSLAGAGIALAAISYETKPAALLGNTVGALTSLAFDGPTGIAGAVNQITGAGYSEEPLLHNGMVILVPSATDPTFRRGDLDGDGQITIGDAINVLSYLFSGGTEPSCRDAADGNDDGAITIADPITLLAYLFQGGSPLPAPGTGCGVDPTEDALDCAQPGCQP